MGPYGPSPSGNVIPEPVRNRVNDKNLGSVGQRASKLLAVKVGVLKKKSAPSAIPAKLCASVIGPGSSSSGVESFSKFKGW